jgi:hypothetical protein
MKLVLRTFAVAYALCSLLAATAWSQCNNPTTPGVVICTPTNRSTVVYMPDIAVRATPASGATITKFIIYDNDSRIYTGGKGQTAVDLNDASMFDGNHDVVVKAWDTAGNLYQAKTSFHIVGLGWPSCTVPSSNGINFCTPPPDATYYTNMTVGAAAKGQSAIKNMSVYLSGKLVMSQPNTSGFALAVQLPKQSTPYTVAFKATDTTGHTYTANKTVNASYTYGRYLCFSTCSPGFSIVAPHDEDYVGNTFNLDMQILGNPKPIREIKAYLDRTLVATSSNANLQQEITNAPNGTHILTVQGWDDEGTVYLIQENININVTELREQR